MVLQSLPASTADTRGAPPPTAPSSLPYRPSPPPTPFTPALAPPLPPGALHLARRLSATYRAFRPVSALGSIPTFEQLSYGPHRLPWLVPVNACRPAVDIAGRRPPGVTPTQSSWQPLTLGGRTDVAQTDPGPEQPGADAPFAGQGTGYGGVPRRRWSRPVSWIAFSPTRSCDSIARRTASSALQARASGTSPVFATSLSPWPQR